MSMTSGFLSGAASSSLRRTIICARVGLCAVAALVVAGAVVQPSPAADGAAVDGRPNIRPAIVWAPIPFPRQRMLEMRSYATRHYGMATWRLRKPRVIVEHYTASETLASVVATFSADVPDPELHELPGICAHFVVDKDGVIYQLVRLDVMCRHTVGLNWTAVGIEHVGTSARQILHNARQMRASLALTTWLMRRLTVGIGDVIGHNQSVTSRFHRERRREWRCQTHQDWSRSEMKAYRSRLAQVARSHHVSLGSRVKRVNRC
jgi:N-acetylmuramoyl-L-alanine amidase